MQQANKIEVLVEDPSLNLTVAKNSATRFWLAEGANYFGRDAWNRIQYPGEAVAQYAGILFLHGDRVLLRVAADQKILHNGKSVDNIYIFAENTSLELEYAGARFGIIREGNRFALSVI